MIGLIYLILAPIAIALVSDPTGLGDLVVGILIGGAALIPPTYFWLCGTFMDGRTPGKMLLGLRVVTVDGYPASSLQHLLRSLFLVVDSFPPVLTYPGFIVALLTSKRQRLGDIVARTLVVRDPKNVLDSEPFANETYENLPNRTSEFGANVAAKLDKKDLEFLRSLLLRQGLEADLKRRLYVRAGRHFADKIGVDGFEDARLFLRDLYVFLREAREARA